MPCPLLLASARPTSPAHSLHKLRRPVRPALVQAPGDVGGWGGTSPPRLPPTHTRAHTHTFRRGKLRPGARGHAPRSPREWRSGLEGGAEEAQGRGAGLGILGSERLGPPAPVGPHPPQGRSSPRLRESCKVGDAERLG